jgi:hypothetical protein
VKSKDPVAISTADSSRFLDFARNDKRKKGRGISEPLKNTTKPQLAHFSPFSCLKSSSVLPLKGPVSGVNSFTGLE